MVDSYLAATNPCMYGLCIASGIFSLHIRPSIIVKPKLVELVT